MTTINRIIQADISDHMSAMRRYVLFFLLITIICTTLIAACPGDVIARNGTVLREDSSLLSSAFKTPGGLDGNYSVYFFYNTHCGSCHEAIEYLQNTGRIYRDFSVQFHDLYNNEESHELFERMRDGFNSTYIGYPVVFIGDVAIDGSDSIQDHFTVLYDENQRLRGDQDKETDLLSFFLYLYRLIFPS